MADTDDAASGGVTMPRTEFSADEEKAMRAARAASATSSWSLTPYGRALVQGANEGANVGSKLPDDAIDRQ